MAKKQNIEELIDKFHKGEISKREFKHLLNWYNSFNDTDTVIQHTEKLELDQIKQRMFNRIASKTILIPKDPNIVDLKSLYKRNLKWIISTVASILVILGSVFYLKNNEQLETHQNIKPAEIENIKPEFTNAQIILPNGKELELRPEPGGIVIDDNIRYTNGSDIVVTNEQTLLKDDQPILIKTPKGGTYQIKLPDGSEILLNAGSQITYSTSFNSGKIRSIKLEGEAFFKVAKKTDKFGNRIPFIVKTNRQEIEVLGTEFNVMDYKQYSYAHTTLIKGQVALKTAHKSQLLKPNQQWYLDNNKSSVKQVDTESFTAWRDGKFDFNNKSLQNILDEMSLWYDIDVIYLSEVPNVEITGQAYRNSNLNLILRLLQVAKVKYSIDVSKRQLFIN